MEFYDNETGMPKRQPAPTDAEINSKCANIMNSFMEMAQGNLCHQNMLINDLESLRELSGGRSDIGDAIEDLKQNIICNETAHWQIAEEWFKFFAGIRESGGTDKAVEAEEVNTDNEDEDDDEENIAEYSDANWSEDEKGNV